MTRDNTRRIIVALYTHPEIYPPVLNAIDELTAQFNEVFVISRNLKSTHWKYPDNAKLDVSGKFIPIRESERKPLWWKLNSFLRFTLDFSKMIRQKKPQWVMCNDPISLMSFRLIRPFLSVQVKLWYHNHDVVELASVRKFSVGYFSVKTEKKMFTHIDLFTLPSASRLAYFPINRLKGGWLIVPNYPSRRRMPLDPVMGGYGGTEMKLLYQGHVGEGHGLTRIIEFIKTDPSLRLTIVGPGNDDYIQLLKDKVKELEISNQVQILDVVPYSELVAITRAHQVGLAIHEPVNLAFRTAALASNKIYEYAAAGLPILYYRDEHYMKHLGNYQWAFPTSLDVVDLSKNICRIRKSYRSLSESARRDFFDKLNFAAIFKPVLDRLEDLSGTRLNIKRTNTE